MERIELKSNQMFVTCIDKFMSGWGKADGLTNKLIFLCDNEHEANNVFENIEERSDMKNPQIHATTPTDFRHTKGREYETNGKFVQIKDKDEYPNFYRKGFFFKKRN